jgi:hypothetical protein
MMEKKVRIPTIVELVGRLINIATEGGLRALMLVLLVLKDLLARSGISIYDVVRSFLSS